MTDANPFAGLVPGFDFLRSLMSSATQSMPAMGQWVAPTLDPAEIDKRIGELKTVQFWLEQNARMLATTIQALEVQRMTLATLQTMNLPVAELRGAMTLPEAAPRSTPPRAAPARPAEPAARPAAAPPPAAETPQPAADAAKPAADAPKAAEAPKPAGVDPMQWWGALTQQFGQLAAKALEDGQSFANRTLAAAAAPASGPARAAAQPVKPAKPAAAEQPPRPPSRPARPASRRDPAPPQRLPMQPRQPPVARARPPPAPPRRLAAQPGARRQAVDAVPGW